MESIEINTVVTPLGSAKLGDIVNDENYKKFYDAFRKWKEEQDRTGFIKPISYSALNINRIDKILFFPGDHLFEVYSKDVLVASISSKEFKVEYK
jgi:hypothetical protein